MDRGGVNSPYTWTVHTKLCANTLRYPLNPPNNPVGWVLTNEKLNNSPEVTWLVSSQETENLVC